MKLKECKVVFDTSSHTYTSEDGKQLSGITSILKRYLFADMYRDVPATILQTAADRGSNIHSEIEALISGFEPVALSQEAENYKSLNINAIESEYLISDNESVASSIDIIDDELNLYDIKTTSVLNIDYLRWQLSIYAYLFELQNTALKAGKLYAIHLRGDICKIVEIERIQDEHIIALLDAFKNNDESFENPLNKVPADVEKQLELIADLEFCVIESEKIVKEYKAKQEAIKQALLQAMQEHNVQKFETNSIVVTKKDEYIRNSVDSKKLQENYPDIYNIVLKQSKVKETIIIKIK